MPDQYPWSRGSKLSWYGFLRWFKNMWIVTIPRLSVSGASIFP